jgi:hypothetical protein
MTEQTITRPALPISIVKGYALVCEHVTALPIRKVAGEFDLPHFRRDVKRKLALGFHLLPSLRDGWPLSKYRYFFYGLK